MLPGVLRQNAFSRAPPDPDEQKEFSDDTESALVASQTSLERFEKGFVAAVNLMKAGPFEKGPLPEKTIYWTQSECYTTKSS